MTPKTDSIYIKWSISIGFFEKYVNSKSDYLELLLSLYIGNVFIKFRVINGEYIFEMWRGIVKHIY